VEDEAARVHRLEEKADAIAQRLANHPSQPIWARFWGARVDLDRPALETRLENLKRKIPPARVALAAAKGALQTEERKFQKAQVQHETALSARRVQAEQQIATARAARAFVERYPCSAFWGAARLIQVAAHIRSVRTEPDHELAADWDLVPIFDVWGIPHLPPPPKAF
jgi:hypothetical protein